MEVILMIGIPGSGKTTISQIAFPNHANISLDKIKKFPTAKKYELLNRYAVNDSLPPNQKLSMGRSIEHVMINDALKDGKNVVIDDTNVTREIRRRHIRLASQYGATINAIFFQNIQKAYEQNRTRREGALDRKILDKFHKELEMPHESEGFEFIQIIY